MTDAELIRKQAERITVLEEQNQTLSQFWNKSVQDWGDAEVKLEEAENKLKQIENEVNQCQYDSATNLQNKIKTILMSESGANEH